MKENRYEKMSQQAIAEQEHIELRSEKVRNLIGEMPPFLSRWGNVVLIVILLFLAIIAVGLFGFPK